MKSFQQRPRRGGRHGAAAEGSAGTGGGGQADDSGHRGGQGAPEPQETWSDSLMLLTVACWARAGSPAHAAAVPLGVTTTSPPSQ